MIELWRILGRACVNKNFCSELSDNAEGDRPMSEKLHKFLFNSGFRVSRYESSEINRIFNPEKENRPVWEEVPVTGGNLVLEEGSLPGESTVPGKNSVPDANPVQEMNRIADRIEAGSIDLDNILNGKNPDFLAVIGVCCMDEKLRKNLKEKTKNIKSSMPVQKTAVPPPPSFWSRHPSDFSEGCLDQLWGVYHLRTGDMEKADLRLRHARIQWSDAKMLWSLALLWEEQGKYRKAFGLYKEIIARKGWAFYRAFPAFWVLAHYHAGLCLDMLGHPSQALQYYEHFVNLWGGHGSNLPWVEWARSEIERLRR